MREIGYSIGSTSALSVAFQRVFTRKTQQQISYNFRLLIAEQIKTMRRIIDMAFSGVLANFSSVTCNICYQPNRSLCIFLPAKLTCSLLAFANRTWNTLLGVIQHPLNLSNRAIWTYARLIGIPFKHIVISLAEKNPTQIV